MCSKAAPETRIAKEEVSQENFGHGDGILTPAEATNANANRFVDGEIALESLLVNFLVSNGFE